MKTILIVLVAGWLLSACTPDPAAAAIEAQQAQQAKQKMEQIKKDLDQASQLYDKKLNDTVNAASSGETTANPAK